MTVLQDAWLPNGHVLPGGAACGRRVCGAAEWQIIETSGRGRALLAHDSLALRWLAAGLMDESNLETIVFGTARYRGLCSGPNHTLAPVADGPAPRSRPEALAFALSLKTSRRLDAATPFEDAIYVERFTRLLPAYGVAVRADDDLLLGQWLAGGATISTKSFERLLQSSSWLSAGQLKEIIEAAGLAVPMEEPLTAGGPSNPKSGIASWPGAGVSRTLPTRPFELAGRPQLAAFLNEHIVDILQNRERYKALGIGFPAAVVLHGPPGCGKTFAVEQLIDFLGWPDFSIDAASVASPYIHETSRKVAALFDDAIKNSPSVLVIDEMEAFLADREAGAGQHRVEEVAEFLRRIPEAAKNEVLIIAMTNRIDLIDPAILRRGRFDHIIKVDFASEADIASLLAALLAPLPKGPDVDPAPLARALRERPLSDVAFVVREGARRAARGGRDRLNQADLLAALVDAPTRDPDAAKRNRIGFV